MKLAKKFSDVLSCYNDFLNDREDKQAIARLNPPADDLPVAAAVVWLKVRTGVALTAADQTVIKKIQTDWQQETRNVFGEAADRYTSNLGIYYIALSEVKNTYQLYDLQKEITDIRDYIFDHLIRKGSLISSVKKGRPDYDLVLSVLPFGLFAPEDLIVVSGIQELTKRTENLSQNQAALLGIYFTEKYDFVQADRYLNEAEAASEGDGTVLAALLKTYLRQKKENLSENAFIHKPLGNGNVYDTLPYERSPHYPSAGGTCVFNVQVNRPDVSRVVMTLDGVAENIPCQLVDDVLHIYQGTVELPDDYPGGRYFFVAEGGRKETSAYYDLLIRSTVTFNQMDFLGATAQENVYRVQGDGNTLYIGLQAAKCRLFEQQPDLVSDERLEQCAFIDEARNLVLPDGRPLIQWHPQMLRAEKLAGRGIISVTLRLVDDATVYYGFGERYNALNQYGNRIDCFVYNQYRDQGTKTYLPMPYFFTDKGYGLYVNTDYYTQFDLQKERPGIVEIYAETEPDAVEVEIALLSGTMKDMISQYIRYTGTPVMLPSWAFGPWMSSNNWDRESIVREQVALTNHYQVPATVIVLEQWSDETTYYMFNDAQYPLLAPGESHSYSQMTFPEWGRWPDPQGLIAHCHDNGLKFILWQIPIEKYLNQQKHPLKDQDEQYMIEKGYVVQNADGTPYRIPENWYTDSLLMDFTNEEAKQWWFAKRQYLIDIGVDGFKTDGGEMVYGADVRFADGSNGRQMRNKYPKEYIKAYYDFARQNNGITFSRSGYTGAQTYPAHWAGDERSTFDAFERQLIAGINAGMSGVIFWGWDLGGFNGDIPTAELFMRSAAMAAFCPIMQYHAESKGEFNQDRTPWNIAERTQTPEVIAVYRFFANTRMNLLPYLSDQAQKSVTECVPLMRALQLEYPDEDFYHCYDQFMLGDALLVAPVIKEGVQSRKVTLPAGIWTDFWTHDVYEGNRTIEVLADVHQIPVFIKENTAVLLNVGESGQVGGHVGNDVTQYTQPKLIIAAKDDFQQTIRDHVGNTLHLTVNASARSVTCEGELAFEIEWIEL